MKVSSTKSKIMLLMLCCAIVVTGALLGGCAGSDGAAGANGTSGTNGADLTLGTVDAKQLTFDDLRNTALGVKILSASTAGNQPVVTIQVVNKNTNEGISGLRTFALHVAQLQPEAAGSNSYWMNYITSASTTTGSFRPTADPVTYYSSSTGSVIRQGYSVVDNMDGTYVITFASNIKSGTTAQYSSTSYVNPASATYDATLTHRIVVGVRSVAVPGVVGKTPGAYAGPINPITGSAFAQFTNINGANAAIDFVPSTGAVLTTSARDIVTMDSCNKCHYKVNYGFPIGNNTSGHFGSRTDTKTCVMCHTPQNFVTGQTATTNVDFTPYIHKLHMGEELPLVESNLTGTYEVKYPQNIKNCDMCHTGVNGSNWNTKPSKKACGSCHNNINFAGGTAPAGMTNHTGSTQATDANCVSCHAAADIQGYHDVVSRSSNTYTTSVTPAYSNNSHPVTGQLDIKYVITSVSVSGDRTPSVTFKITNAGTAVTFPTYTTGATLIPNTTGGPSIAFVYNQTQDGITPSDYNGRVSTTLGPGNPVVNKAGVFVLAPAASSLWSNGSTTTSSGITWTLIDNGSGSYTVTNNAPLPASATMLTAALYGSITQTNLAAPYDYAAASEADYDNYISTSWRLKKPGLIINAQAAIKAFTGDAAGTTWVARRTNVDNAKCNACHDQLGSKPIFHGGARNDGAFCNFCHMPNTANAGWSYNANTFIHGIHAAAKRTTAYTFASDWSTVTYPGLIKNCEQCHSSGGYDLSNSQVSKLLMNTVGTGTYGAIGTNGSPYIPDRTGATNYGTGFAYTASTGTTAEASATTLVVTPVTSACFSCHDSSAAMAHMESNGGAIYKARSAVGVEQCVVCHGPAGNTAFGDYVPAVKNVHRWW